MALMIELEGRSNHEKEAKGQNGHVKNTFLSLVEHKKEKKAQN